MLVDKVVLFLLTMCDVTGTLGQSYKEMDSLVEYLFNETRYNKLIRPLRNQSNVVKINFTQFVNSIEYFDISTGELLITGYFEIKWIDEMLTWNPALYGGKNQIMLPKEKYWKPDFSLTNGPANEVYSIYGSGFAPAWVNSQGMVRIIPAGSYKTKCNVDTTFYPYDMHTCKFQFVVSNHDATEILVSSPSTGIHFSDLKEHGEWEIKKTYTEVLLIKEDTIEDITFPMFLSSFSMKRRPAFELVNSFSPLVLMSNLNMATCFVRPNSGERLTFAITLYLSLVLATSATINRIPVNSLKMSYLSYQLLALNCINTIGVLWSIYIVHCTSSEPDEEQHLPKFLLTVVQRKRKQRNKFCVTHVPVDKTRQHSVKSFEQAEIHVDDNIKQKEESFERNSPVSGLEVAEALDRIYFWIVAAFTLVIHCIFAALTYKSWFT